MITMKHLSAKSSHYNESADTYDLFNDKDEQSAQTNRTILAILNKHHTKSVLDLTCGTGSQVFFLAQHGFKVHGSDFNNKMLKIAKEKAKQKHLKLKFSKGDMRTAQYGKFDAVLTVFNAVGHLTKSDFETAMKNIAGNLNSNGLYIFDIYNQNYFIKDDTITKLTIDWLKTSGNKKNRYFQYSTINADGILASYTTTFEQINNGNPKIQKSKQTLQIYTVQQLEDMLNRSGFKILNTYSIDGTDFIEDETERLLLVAQKIKN